MSFNEYYRLDEAPAPATNDLRDLKQATADAHPDRGGSSAAFIEARRRYLKAKEESIQPPT
jgi:hypothetical protein